MLIFLEFLKSYPYEEFMTVNHWVAGSSPARGAKEY